MQIERRKKGEIWRGGKKEGRMRKDEERSGCKLREGQG